MILSRIRLFLEAHPGSLRARVLSGALWTTGANLLSRISSFASTLVVVRLLEPELFGQFGIINSTLMSFAIVATLGMGVAATKLVAQYRTSDRLEVGKVIASARFVGCAAGATIGLAITLGAQWIATHVLSAPALATELRLVAAGLFFVAWGGAQSGVLAGLEAFGLMAKLGMCFAVGSASLVALGAWVGGLRGAIIAIPVTGFIQCVVQEFILQKTLRHEDIVVPLRLPLQRVRVVLRLGVPVTLAALLFLPASWACSTLLVNQPGGYDQNAVITISEQWFNLVLTLPAILGQVLVPVLTNIFSQGNQIASRSALRKTFWTNAMISVAPLAFLLPASPYLLRVYGQDYSQHWPVLCLLVISATISAILSPAGHALTATGRMWIALAMNLGWAVCYVIGTYIFVVRLQGGAKGLATARLVAYGVHATWSLWYLRSVIKEDGHDILVTS